MTGSILCSSSRSYARSIAASQILGVPAEDAGSYSRCTVAKWPVSPCYAYIAEAVVTASATASCGGVVTQDVRGCSRVCDETWSRSSPGRRSERERVRPARVGPRSPSGGMVEVPRSPVAWFCGWHRRTRASDQSRGDSLAANPPHRSIALFPELRREYATVSSSHAS